MTVLLIIIFSIIASIVSGYLVYKKLEPSIKTAQSLDENTEQKNKQIKSENIKLIQERDNLLREKDNLIIQKDSTAQQIETLKNSIAAIEAQAQEAADLFYSSKLKVAQEHLEVALEQESQKFQSNIQNFNVQYNEVVNDLMIEYNELKDNIAVLRATNDAAIAAAKRAEEMKSQLDYYRIQLAPADISEIDMLRQVEPYLRDKEPLNKVIWKCYYEKPTTDMIGRVIGSGIHTGIYKITEIETGKCYVGQAANLADRWKQHIKRGVGAETPTRNKLYPAMRASGPENFSFEVIEECDRSVLDEREDYWQLYFKAKEFGYSIK